MKKWPDIPFFLLCFLTILCLSLIRAEVAFAQEYALQIHKKTFALSVLKKDKIVAQYKVAVGKSQGNKQKRGDLRTPEGTFTVQKIHKASHWTHDFKDGKGEIQGAYGPWFVRLSTPPWSGIGIHGTHDPSSIGTNASEGCIRVKNEDLEELVKKYIRVGMRVTVLP